jgi:hypothetical protein
MSAPKAGSSSDRRDWYRAAIGADPVRQRRFAEALERANTPEGTPDDPEALDRLLDR